MQIMYAASANAFYAEGLSKEIPADAKPITGEVHREMINGPANCLRMVPGPGGMPTLIPRPTPTRDEIAAARQQSYADPINGSDRCFAEAARLQVMGAPQGEIDAAKSAGVQRYEEIQSAFPWPVDSD